MTSRSEQIRLSILEWGDQAGHPGVRCKGIVRPVTDVRHRDKELATVQVPDGPGGATVRVDGAVTAAAPVLGAILDALSPVAEAARQADPR